MVKSKELILKSFHMTLKEIYASKIISFFGSY